VIYVVSDYFEGVLQMLRVLHVADLGFGLGGISQVVPRMIQEQNKLHGVETQLLVPSASKYRTNLGFICHSTTNLETIEKTIVNTFKPDLAVFHGLYIKEYIKLSQLFDRLSIPYAIVPHGGFSRVVQGKGRLKKTVANHLFFRKFISKASAILFLTEGERQNSFFHHDKAFIVPNGIDLPDQLCSIASKGPLNDEGFTMTFIGKIDFYYKGIDKLLEAVSLVRSDLRDRRVTIEVCGNAVADSEKRLLSLIKKLDINDLVVFKGPVYNKEKSHQYLNTDIFVLTSRSEGMPTVILEALSYAVPCLVTTGTNMSDLLTRSGAGWGCDFSVESIADYLLVAVEDYKKNKHVLKRNARALAEQFTWEHSARESVKVYQAIVKRRQR
jgi:glycosyltransferase involved in cell wall biosynthesis